jgi:glycosyltransferase involved in cell wall biosynthesis/GT2 family glycosyltransferase
MIDPNSPDYEDTPASPRRAPFSYAPVGSQVVPQVTIVTPFYNEGAIFHETAQSVFRQSFQQWEWIIVNDASTDPDALEVLRPYRGQDPRVRVIDQEINQGPSAARNVAFRLAAAGYVVHLDSDNLLEPTAIEKWLWYLETHPECAFVKGFTVGFGAEKYLTWQGFHDGAKFLDRNQIDTTSMIRRDVHRAVGGFDESIREGLEDWDFWIRCAAAGFWGGTVHEYLDWYRRRASHADRWKNWDGGERERKFGADLRQRFSHLWEGGFPRIQPREHVANETVPDELPCENVLAKKTRRILIIVPWLVIGGADKFTLDLVQQLTERGWEVTVATTLGAADPWHAEFGRHTPDIFLLHRFLRLVDYPRFLRYLIASRQIDVVLVSQSELGYLLLPYLRAHFPQVSFLDFSHIEEQWKNGGYPRMAVEYQELLDLNVVTSEHLKQWMIARRAEAERIHACYIGVDPEIWRPDGAMRAIVRRQLGIEERVPVILYAGRVCPQKQPRVFAGTILRLHRQGITFAAVVAGDGPDLDWLRQFVKQHDLGRCVYFQGAVPNQRVNELMKGSDVFFLPSEWEGIALSIYEAMASGVAVVGGDVGGQRELVAPDCGILISRGDEQHEVEAYSAALAALLGDPVRRSAMGAASRARVCAGFRVDQMGQNMVHLIETAMKLHTAQPRPVPSLRLGRACASQAVEYMRINHVADVLWASRAGAHGLIAPAKGVTWRDRVYTVCRWLYGPLYRRGMARGGAWYFAIANKLKGALLQTRQ